MRHIYYEKKEIPIPEGGHVNRHDGAVRIYLDPTVQRRKSATMVIGKATSATTMPSARSTATRSWTGPCSRFSAAPMSRPPSRR